MYVEGQLKLYADFRLCGPWVPLTLALFKGQLYFVLSQTTTSFTNITRDMGKGNQSLTHKLLPFIEYTHLKNVTYALFALRHFKLPTTTVAF